MLLLKKYLIILFTLAFVLIPLKSEAFGWFKNIRFGHYSQDEYVESFSQAKNSLNNLISEYESKNLLRLMDNVSERYSTDKDILEDSIRKEFSKSAFIELRYYVDKVLFNEQKNEVLITITYIKRTQNRSTSKLVIKNGTSDLIFRKQNDKYLLWKMKPKFMGK